MNIFVMTLLASVGLAAAVLAGDEAVWIEGEWDRKIEDRALVRFRYNKTQPDVGTWSVIDTYTMKKLADFTDPLQAYDYKHSIDKAAWSYGFKRKHWASHHICPKCGRWVWCMTEPKSPPRCDDCGYIELLKCNTFDLLYTLPWTSPYFRGDTDHQNFKDMVTEEAWKDFHGYRPSKEWDERFEATRKRMLDKMKEIRCKRRHDDL